MGKPCNCFHLQRIWGLKQSYRGTDTKERIGSFNTITLMAAHGNPLNHSFSKSNTGHWGCSTKMKCGGINVRRQPPVRGNDRFGCVIETNFFKKIQLWQQSQNRVILKCIFFSLFLPPFHDKECFSTSKCMLFKTAFHMHAQSTYNSLCDCWFWILI